MLAGMLAYRHSKQTAAVMCSFQGSEFTNFGEFCIMSVPAVTTREKISTKKCLDVRFVSSASMF